MATLHWTHLPQPPLQPLLLTRDASLVNGLAQLQAVGEQIGHSIQAPQRSAIALQGKAALGVALTDPRFLAAALEGDYATAVWSDLRPAMESRWPQLKDSVIAVLFGGASELAVWELRDLVFGALSFAPTDEVSRALRFCWRAWHLRQQMLLQRPLSLLPAVGGDALADVVSFTPVLTWLTGETWQIGWEGDKRKDAPYHYNATSPTAALEVAWEVFSRWYHEEETALTEHLRLEAKRLCTPPHLHTGSWLRDLRQHAYLQCGELFLENVSHNQIFRLTTPRRGQSVFRGTTEQAVAILQVAAQQYAVELPAPTAEEVTQAYLWLLTGKETGFVAADFDPKPLTGAVTAWQIGEDANSLQQVAIPPTPQVVRGHTVIGVITANNQRALLVAGGKGVIELLPISKGSLGRALGSVSVIAVPLRESAWQQALAAWALYIAAQRGG